MWFFVVRRSSTEKYFVVRSSTLYSGNSALLPDYCTLFESSAKMGRVRSRMGSGHRMGRDQQVTIKFYRHMFLLVYICTLRFESSGTASCGTTGNLTRLPCHCASLSLKPNRLPCLEQLQKTAPWSDSKRRFALRISFISQES